MSLARAIHGAFNGALSAMLPLATCAHTNVAFSGHHCPDCGKAVVVEWVQVRCTRCHTRRAPKNTLAPPFTAEEKHCRFCGSTDIIVQKKAHIERDELPLSLLYRTVSLSPTPLTLHQGLQHGMAQHMASAARTTARQQAFQSIIEITVD